MNNISRRSFLTLAGTGLAAFGLAACGGNNAPATTSAATGAATTTAATTAAAGGKTYRIGILQLTQHEALDAAHDGFVAGLKEAGIAYEITNDLNASGDQSACQTAAQTLVNDKNDLILAIATPAVEACAGATTEIPVIGTAVTDFAGSGLVASNDAPGGNITGTSDLTPVAEQFELINKLFPQAKKVGLLYASNESNSEIQATMAREAAAKYSLETQDFTVSNTNDIQSVVESAVGKIDVLYCPTDNTIASGMATVAQICNENKLPTVVGGENMVKNGGLVSYSINYTELGKRAAAMAVKVLKGEKPATMAIEHLAAEECTLVKNEETAKTLGVDLSVLDSTK